MSHIRIVDKQVVISVSVGTDYRADLCTLRMILCKIDLVIEVQARLVKAQSLLHDTGLRLLDIALMLGYSEPATFSRAFRRWTGVSPREYRDCREGRTL